MIWVKLLLGMILVFLSVNTDDYSFIESPIEIPVKQVVAPAEDPEVVCFVKTLFHESRGEGDKGIKLTAQVIMNRVRDNRFPKTVCEVVKQRHAFSFYSPTKISGKLPTWWYRYLKKIATNALQGSYQGLLKPSVVFYKVCDFESDFFNTRKLVLQYNKHCFHE